MQANADHGHELEDARNRRDYSRVIALGYEALSREDFETFSTGLHPDLEYESVLMGLEGSAAVFRGPRGMQEWFDSRHEVWSSWQLNPIELTQVDDECVVGVIEFDGVASGSDLPIHAEFGVLYRFKDGLVFRIEDHPNREAALEAARLSRWKLWRWKLRQRREGQQ